MFCKGREGRSGWWDGRMERRNPPGIYDSHYHAIAQQPPPGALTFMGFTVKAALTTYLPPVIVKSLRRHYRPRPRLCHSLGVAPPYHASTATLRPPEETVMAF